jgi:hypothetical protein
MRRSKSKNLLSLALSALGFALLPGCASVPRFEPSTPLAGAGSLRQALLLCDEYTLEGEAVRPVSMKPWVTCLNDAGRLFEEDAFSRFSIFRKELERFYQGIEEDAWTPELSREVEASVHAVLRTLWRGERPGVYEWIERAAVRAHFPRTARALNARSWAISDSGSQRHPAEPARIDRAFESLNAGLNDLESKKVGSTSQMAPRLMRLRSDLAFLKELRRDAWELEKLNPDSPVLAGLQSRYQDRLLIARAELTSLQRAATMKSKKDTP